MALTSVVVIAMGIIGVYWSVRLAIAGWDESRQQRSSVVRAVALAPGNEAYLRRAAELTDEVDGDGTTYYRRAVATDPYASHDWIRLALHAERAGHKQEATADLLNAAHYDRLFEPRWTLANYYFRAGDRAETLRWVYKLLEIAEADFAGIFRLCWQTTGDPTVILADAIPARPLVLAQYLGFLCATRRLDPAAAVADRLVPLAREEQVARLLNYCDLALSCGQLNYAAIVWNGLSRRRLIPFGSAGGDPAHLVVNSDFRRPPTGKGFDWRITAPEGTRVHSDGANGILIDFAGNEPERCVILSQYIDLSPATRYHLHVKYEAPGIALTGLIWRVLDATTGESIPHSSLELPRGSSEDAYTSFQTPALLRLPLLQMVYERPAGNTPLKGTVTLSLVELAAGA